MTPELIISIISLVATFIVGVFTAIVTFKVGKFEHLEKLKKYEKNITNFELQFKDETWLYNLINEEEFDHYNMASKKRIYRWWVEYCKNHTPVLLMPHVNYNNLREASGRGLGWFGSTGGANTNLIMPGDEEVPNPEDLF